MTRIKRIKVPLLMTVQKGIDNLKIEFNCSIFYPVYSEDTAAEEGAPTSSIVVTASPDGRSYTTEIYDYKHYRKEVRRNTRISIFLITITIMFGISWLPWNAFNVVIDLMPDIDLTAKTLYLILAICHLMAMSSATTNAIHYGFYNTNIKSEIRYILSELF